MTILEIGCCGAYCKKCIQQQKQKYPNENCCLGCKIGYRIKTRNIERAKCKIKICCFKEKQLQTCADCSKYPCNILEAFFNKGRAKYRKHWISSEIRVIIGSWKFQINGKVHQEN